MAMTPERWRQICDVYEAVVDCAEPRRPALLTHLCSADPDLRREVESLLCYETGDFLGDPPDGRISPVALTRDLAGTRLGSYEIRARIGSGGMGDVYASYDPRLERTVAIKVVRAGFAQDAERRRRFEREARAAAALNHPNVVAVYDVGTHDDTPFIVMEYVEGETLRTVLTTGRPPLKRALEIVSEIADALVAAHAEGIVHRDLKPSNVMLTRAGRVKVLDFGLARTLERVRPAPSDALTASRAAVTERGRAMGTPGYMAPEQLLGERGDHRADIFSLGVVLFELVTGCRPFDGDDLMTFGMNVFARPARSAADVNPSVPDAIATLIQSAIARKPESRPQSARQLKEDLDRVRLRVAPPKVRWQRAAVAAAAVAMGTLFVVARPTVTTPLSPASTRAEPTRIAVLPAINLSGRPDTAGWSSLVQTLVAGELTGLPNVGVLDPLSLNGRLSSRRSQPGADQAAVLETIRDVGAHLVITTQVVPAAAGLDLQLSVVDMASGEARFSTVAHAALDADLPGAARTLAGNVVKYLQVQVLAGDDKDLAPWLSLRDRNIDAVKAFATANELYYQNERNEIRAHLLRAIELDPLFIAPRVWYINALIARSDRSEAERQYTALQGLKDAADPFEQAMIGWIGARLRREAESQIRYLETALTYSPSNNILLINLAQLRASSGNCTRALSDLDGPVRMKWHFPGLYPLWGWCAIQEGRVDDARQLLKESLDFVAVDPNVYSLLEALELALGSEEEAARYAALAAERLRKLDRESNASILRGAYARLAEYCRRRGNDDRADLLTARAQLLGSPPR